MNDKEDDRARTGDKQIRKQQLSVTSVWFDIKNQDFTPKLIREANA